MIVQYAVFEVKFLVPVRFLMKGFCRNVFKNMHFMSVVGKESKSWFYIEYSIYTPVLVL